MQIKIDDLSGPAVHALLQKHLDDMAVHSPPESIHALDLTELRRPEITFWTVWDNSGLSNESSDTGTSDSGHSYNDLLMGCGAIKELSPEQGEIKSMRTAPHHLRKGVAAGLLEHILTEAKHRGYTRVSLETGSMDAFKPARNLYTAAGFIECEPFGDYKVDPNSIFMTLAL